MNGDNTPIFNSKNLGGIFRQYHLLMCKEGQLIGGLCGLFHRSVYQDFDSLSMIPISGTILILPLIDVLLDVTKKDKKGLMSLISQIFKTFVKPYFINSNVLFHFPTTMKEADVLLLCGSNSIFVNFPIEDVYTFNNHAYISLIQKLYHSMAHGIHFHFIYDGDGNCRKAQQRKKVVIRIP